LDKASLKAKRNPGTGSASKLSGGAILNARRRAGAVAQVAMRREIIVAPDRFRRVTIATLFCRRAKEKRII
jgi:hypothetical protein